MHTGGGLTTALIELCLQDQILGSIVHFLQRAQPQPWPFIAAKYKVLFSAGIHGNEPAGAECTLRFVEAIARKPENYKDIALDIIPLINPWGWMHDIRFNQAGIDINRDFATLNSQEAKIIRQALGADPYNQKKISSFNRL